MLEWDKTGLLDSKLPFYCLEPHAIIYCLLWFFDFSKKVGRVILRQKQRNHVAKGKKSC